MKVYELINILQTMPQDAAVIVRGYEDGVNKVDRVVDCNIKPKVLGCLHDDCEAIPWYYGEYDISEKQGEQAVYISSSRDDDEG